MDKKRSLIRVTEDDAILEAIAALEKDIFEDAWSKREIASTATQKNAICGVIKEEETVLGYFLSYYVLDECELARIAVDQSNRKSGVGQQLFAYMKELCKEKQVERILLDVRESNDAAIRFYEKQGFQVDGRRKGYYQGEHPEDAILKSLAI